MRSPPFVEADRPTARARRRARARSGCPPTTAIGRYSIAPAAAFATTGVMRALRWRGSTMPVAPAVSANAATAPRLRGSLTPSSATRNASGAREQLVEVGRRAAARPCATTPCGASLRASASMRSGADDLQRAARRARGSRRRRRSSRTELDTMTVRTWRRPRPQQLEHRAPAFDLLAAQRLDVSSTPSPAAGPSAWRQTVPFGVSSSTMPRASSSSRMRSASAKSLARARLVALRRRARRSSSSSSASSSCELDARARRTARARSRPAPRPSSVAPSSSAVFASRRSVEHDRDRGRRVEVVVHRGAELGRDRRRSTVRRTLARARRAHERVEPLDRLLRRRRAPSSPISIWRR